MGSDYLCRRARLSFPRLFTLKAVASTAPEPQRWCGPSCASQIGALLTHPNLLRVLDMGSYEGQPFRILEYVEGASLADLMIPGQPADPALVVAADLDTLRGLGAAHEATDQQGKPLGPCMRSRRRRTSWWAPTGPPASTTSQRAFHRHPGRAEDRDRRW